MTIIVEFGFDIEDFDDVGDEPRQLLVLLDFGAIVFEGLIDLFHVVRNFVGLKLVLLQIALEHLNPVADLLVCEVLHLLQHRCLVCHSKNI